MKILSDIACGVSRKTLPQDRSNRYAVCSHRPVGVTVLHLGRRAAYRARNSQKEKTYQSFGSIMAAAFRVPLPPRRAREAALLRRSRRRTFATTAGEGARSVRIRIIEPNRS